MPSATPLRAALCAAATSALLSVLAAPAFADPSEVTNTQVQLGDVFSQQTLDVVTADSTTAVTTATGNGSLGAVENGSAHVVSSQTLSGSVTAQTRLNVSGSPGDATVLSTAATGNSGDAGVTNGALTGTFTQSVTQAPAGTGLTARAQIEGEFAQGGDVSESTQAIANSQGFGLTASTSNVAITQSNTADLIADGGAIMQYVSGTGVVSAATVGNNVTAVGVDASSMTYSATQTNTGSLTQASKFTAYGTSQETVTSATASANNVNSSNEGPLLDATVSQTNASYVRAQAEETSFEFGSASTTAYGVGNTSLAGNFGPELHFDNNQINSGGGIESVASFSGDTGYDAYSSSTAMGNATTGYSCSQCTGTMSVTNHQTNSADVGASNTIALTGGARNVTGVSTAVGNNGSFYVSAPHN
ncbi:MAG: hypothetical protein JWP35_4335 [Caulobacter sp.]|nr:hypothetical protein [Caulobacter sp.]